MAGFWTDKGADVALDTINQTAVLRNRLIGALIGLTRAANGDPGLITPSVSKLVLEALTAGEDSAALHALLDRAAAEKKKMVPGCFVCANPCGKSSNSNMEKLWAADEDVRRLKLQILSGIREIAALGCDDKAVMLFLFKALFFLGEDFGPEQLLPMVQEIDGLLSN